VLANSVVDVPTSVSVPPSMAANDSGIDILPALKDEDSH
jgi:hypothetical protein